MKRLGVLFLCILLMIAPAAAGKADSTLRCAQVCGNDLFAITQEEGVTLRLYRYQDAGWEPLLSNATVYEPGGDYGIEVVSDSEVVTYATDGESWSRIMTWRRSGDQQWRLTFYANPDPFYQVAVSDSGLQFYDELELEDKVTAVPVSLDTELSAFDGDAFRAILLEHPGPAQTESD